MIGALVNNIVFLFLQTDNITGSSLYYPPNVRTFVVSSIYDAFLLAPSAQQVCMHDYTIN